MKTLYVCSNTVNRSTKNVDEVSLQVALTGKHDAVLILHEETRYINAVCIVNIEVTVTGWFITCVFTIPCCLFWYKFRYMDLLNSKHIYIGKKLLWCVQSIANRVITLYLFLKNVLKQSHSSSTKLLHCFMIATFHQLNTYVQIAQIPSSPSKHLSRRLVPFVYVLVPYV